MKDEPKAEEGLYPFEECCEHAFRVHSRQACQIPGCPCRRRRQLQKPPLAPTLAEGERPDLVTHLQADGWKLTHEVVQGPKTTMVITRIHKPDGEILDETAWTP